MPQSKTQIIKISADHKPDNITHKTKRNASARSPKKPVSTVLKKTEKYEWTVCKGEGCSAN